MSGHILAPQCELDCCWDVLLKVDAHCCVGLKMNSNVMTLSFQSEHRTPQRVPSPSAPDIPAGKTRLHSLATLYQTLKSMFVFPGEEKHWVTERYSFSCQVSHIQGLALPNSLLQQFDPGS